MVGCLQCRMLEHLETWDRCSTDMHSVKGAVLLTMPPYIYTAGRPDDDAMLKKLVDCASNVPEGRYVAGDHFYQMPNCTNMQQPHMHTHLAVETAMSMDM